MYVSMYVCVCVVLFASVPLYSEYIYIYIYIYKIKNWKIKMTHDTRCDNQKIRKVR